MIHPLRVLLVGDHAIMRHGLKALLTQHDIKVVGDATTSDDLPALARKLEPHIILLDAPVVGSSQLLQQLEPLNPACRTVLLSVSQSELDIHAALEDQVAGYVCKTAAPEKLVNTLHLVASGETVFPRCNFKPRAKSKETDPANSLTQRERQILECVARGLANKGIARELALAEGTVKVHIKAILRKLDLGNRTQAAVYMLRQAS